MTRIKFLFAALVVAAIVAVVPAAQAQSQACIGVPGCTVHVLGAGSSAQYLTSAIGADKFAKTIASGTGQCSFHWTANNAGLLVDTRSNGNSPAIPKEPANMWIVWLANCDGIGNTAITDIWADASVDSTVGVRAFLAAIDATHNGVAVDVIPAAPGNNISPQTLWPDGNLDVSIQAGGATNIPKAIGTDINGINDLHVNVGLTDIRPEDALFATARSLAALNASTLAGLGYGIEDSCGAVNRGDPDECVGAPIKTSQGTGSTATPVAFALGGGTDPLSGVTVRNMVTVPVGASPIIFVFNNNNVDNGKDLNLVTGVKGDGATDVGHYLAAKLFDGTTACTDTNPALTPAGTGNNIFLALREPLSGTMNTTEFNVFRTAGNTSDSQEKGVGANNPLSGLACASGGSRSRVIGTGESRDFVKNTAFGLGYQFFGFANMAKYAGNLKYQYLTVDGVDPFGTSPLHNAAQTPPNCPGPCTQADPAVWNGTSFPTLRNGTYQVWSLYRWVVEDANDHGDAFGPAHLAQASQDQVDSTVADFVPFSTTGATDGLSVYRTHFIRCSTLEEPCDAGEYVLPNNGSATAANAQDSGNALGGGAEAGGDEGGVIVGPNQGQVTTGVVDLVSTCTASASIVAWDAGAKFPAVGIALPSWVGQYITFTPVGGNANPTNGPFLVKSVTSTVSIKVTPCPSPVTSGGDYNYNVTQTATAPGLTGSATSQTGVIR